MCKKRNGKSTVKHGKLWLLLTVLLLAVALQPEKANAAQEDKVWIIAAYDSSEELINYDAAYVIYMNAEYSVYTDTDITENGAATYYLVRPDMSGNAYELTLSSVISYLNAACFDFVDSTPDSYLVTLGKPEENEAAEIVGLVYDADTDEFAGVSNDTTIISSTLDENGAALLGLSSTKSDSSRPAWGIINSSGELLGMITSGGDIFCLLTNASEFGGESDAAEQTTTEGGEGEDAATSGREERETSAEEESDGSGNSAGTGRGSGDGDTETEAETTTKAETTTEEETTTVSASASSDSSFLSNYWWVLLLIGLAVAVIVVIAVAAAVTASKKKKAGKAADTDDWIFPDYEDPGSGQTFVNTVPDGYTGGQTQPLNGMGGISGETQPPDQTEIDPVRQTPAMTVAGIKGVMLGRTWPIGPDGITIGRDPSNVIIYPPQTKGVSRRHCCLFWNSAGSLQLMDTGSSYGTVLVGRGRIALQQPVTVKPGDRFYIGSEDNGFEIRAL